MIIKLDKNEVRKSRRIRVRKKVNGTTERPRLNVYKSLNHIYAQVIDDTKGHTLVSFSTLGKEVAAELAGKSKVQQAYLVGEKIAKLCKSKKIKHVVFDRAGYLYTGRVKALADGARSAGLEF